LLNLVVEKESNSASFFSVSNLIWEKRNFLLQFYILEGEGNTKTPALVPCPHQLMNKAIMVSPARAAATWGAVSPAPDA